jgi:hypothetical protein
MAARYLRRADLTTNIQSKRLFVSENQQVNPGCEDREQQDQRHENDLRGRVSIRVHHVTKRKDV